MYKGSIEVATINKSCRIRFSLIIDDENPKFKNMELISKFKYNGNTYLKIRPHPYITLDISSYMDKNEGWNTNQSVNLNRKDLYLLIEKLKDLYDKFTDVEELFFYDENNNLKVEPELADKYKEILTCSNGKKLWMQPCVVHTDEENDVEYEGIFLCINSVDYFSYFTYTEIGFLIQVLEEINMTDLSMQLIMISKMSENITVDKIETKTIPEQSMEQEIIDIKPSFFRRGQVNTIPDI